jgi:hypothetical protein
LLVDALFQVLYAEALRLHEAQKDKFPNFAAELARLQNHNQVKGVWVCKISK